MSRFYSRVAAASFRPAGRTSIPHCVTSAAWPTSESPLVITMPTSFSTLPAVAGCTRIRTTPPFLIRSRLWIAICQKSRSRVNRIRPSVSARSRTSLSLLLGKSLPAHTTSWLARRRYSTTRRGKFSFSENQHLRRQGISTEFVRKMTGISKTGKQVFPCQTGVVRKQVPFSLSRSEKFQN